MQVEALLALVVSLKVALMATIIASLCGITCARFLHTFRFPGKNALEAIFLLPMVLPPTVVGFILLLFFGTQSPLNWLLEGKVLFTQWAAVAASATVAFPLVYQNARAAFRKVDHYQEKAARTLGAGEFRVFTTITLPLALPGIFSGILLAFARALGEFGATLMVAGNIPGKTQTVPMAIYFAVEANDYGTAVPLVLTVLGLSFTIIFLLNFFVDRHGYRKGEWDRVGSTTGKTVKAFYP